MMKIVNLLSWKRSVEGYTETLCGRYEISPVFMGRTSAQAFTLVRKFVRSGQTTTVCIDRYCSTMREAKETAERDLTLIIDRGLRALGHE